jgi:hypothetical protein
MDFGVQLMDKTVLNDPVLTETVMLFKVHQEE